jgi:hypothetical protein
MNSANVGKHLSLARVIILLAQASMAGALVISLETLPRNGAFGVAVLIPYVALFCFVAAGVLVLPVMAVWPHLRQPGYPLAALWGTVTASVAAAIVDYRGMCIGIRCWPLA